MKALTGNSQNQLSDFTRKSDIMQKCLLNREFGLLGRQHKIIIIALF